MSEFDQQQALLKRLARLDDRTLLWRMRAMGFWHGDLPPDPPEEIAQRAALEAELATLKASGLATNDLALALKQERQRRFAASVERRKQLKIARDEKRAQARAAWLERKASTIVFAGIGVSAGLASPEITSAGTNHTYAQSDGAKLRAAGLPVLSSPEGLAHALGIELGTLRWLTFHRVAAPLVHYSRYSVPKKTGGQRHISAPKPQLKAAQAWVQREILSKLPVTPFAHGFVSQRSSVTNAQLHCGQCVVINLDLKDFFPSITFVRVRELIVAFGYSRAVATLIALLCTEPPRVAGSIAGDVHKKTLHVAIGERALPQGAASSPALTNLLCRSLDRRLAGIANKLGFTYSRYADDLTFSGADRSLAGRMIAAARRILSAEGFRENTDKTHVMGQGARQSVTGIVVNHATPRLARETRRQLRAMLHNAAKNGLDAANLKRHPQFANYLRGWTAYAAMVEPDRGEQWFAALRLALK
jgi:RNA-directed DNA polymerase